MWSFLFTHIYTLYVLVYVAIILPDVYHYLAVYLCICAYVYLPLGFIIYLLVYVSISPSIHL